MQEWLLAVCAYEDACIFIKLDKLYGEGKKEEAALSNWYAASKHLLTRTWLWMRPARLRGGSEITQKKFLSMAENTELGVWQAIRSGQDGAKNVLDRASIFLKQAITMIEDICVSNTASCEQGVLSRRPGLQLLRMKGGEK